MSANIFFEKKPVSTLFTFITSIILYLSPFRVEVDSNPAMGKDEIMFCCGQLIAQGLGEHILCNGKEDKLASGTLLLELEKCPHSGYGARFQMAPLRNLEHQDTIHCCVLSFVCGACRWCFVMEGALLHHIIMGHGGPEGFEVDMNMKHGEHYLVKISHVYKSITTYSILSLSFFFRNKHQLCKHPFCLIDFHLRVVRSNVFSFSFVIIQSWIYIQPIIVWQL